MNSIAEKKEKCEPELIGDRAFQMMINGASGVYEKETGRERGEGVKRERETVNNETKIK